MGTGIMRKFDTENGPVVRELTLEEAEENGGNEWRNKKYKEAKKDTMEERLKALEDLVL